MSSIEFAHPEAWFLLLALIPVLIVVSLLFRRIENALGYLAGDDKRVQYNIRRRLVIRTVCWVFAWFSFAAALSDPSWGTKLVPVQKFGKAASFVFDVSYSMKAADVPLEAGIDRLAAAGNFASYLLDNMNGISVSAVIAKGKGITAVPLTEDFNSLRSLVGSLDPKLMTSAGTSLGSGIKAATTSFPPQFAKNSTIILFTDGDETDGSLESAAINAVKEGFSIIIVGFGAEKETEITAGDGVTKVNTALRAEKLRYLAESVSAEIGKEDAVLFVDSNQSRSLSRVLKSVMTDYESIQTGYELQNVKRFPLLLFISLMFFGLGFFASELRIRKSRLAVLMVTIAFIASLSSCSNRLDSATDVLAGTVSWYQKDYVDATSGFLKVMEKASSSSNDYLMQYGLFGLSSTYIMQNEDEAALERIGQISPDASDDILFAAYYNTGIIAHRKGEYEAATDAFRQALMIDGSNVDAKINLELSLIKKSVVPSAAEQVAGSQDSSADASPRQDLVFSLIKENEKNQWKKTESQDYDSAVIDY
ncbi:MAG: VWA domain-containing protein [Treponemataceae bacterium]|nr:VWA domain-containing protein [Treponemataceae bacterium]